MADLPDECFRLARIAPDLIRAFGPVGEAELAAVVASFGHMPVDHQGVRVVFVAINHFQSPLIVEK